MYVPARLCLLAGLLAWALSHASVLHGQEGPVQPTPAEKLRQALDQTMAFDFQGGTLADVIQHLKEKTKINFMMDAFVLQNMGIGVDPNGNPLTVDLKADKNTKIRTTLQRFLSPYNLTYVILSDSVLITSESMALHRQMRQRVSAAYKDKPLAAALKDLSRATGLSLIIDPKVKADEKVTLELEDAAVETTVRLLAELGGLKSVRLGNVLFITSEAKADKIRREEAPLPPDGIHIPPGIVQPFQVGGAAVGGFGGAAAPFRPVTPEKFKNLQRGVIDTVPGVAPPPGLDAPVPQAPLERAVPQPQAKD